MRTPFKISRKLESKVYEATGEQNMNRTIL